MKLPKTHPSRSGYVRKHSISGKFSVPANEPPANDGKDKGGADDPGDTGKDGDKPLFTQADLNKIGAKEKAAGKRAAEQAFADSLGVSIEDAKKIIADHKVAEDAKKSEADRLKDAAAAEKAEAEKNKSTTAGEVRTARIERALAAEKFPKIDDDTATATVVRMVDVALEASYDDVKDAVKELKKEFPALFAEVKDDGTGKPPKLPGSAPSGKPPAPTGDTESKMDVGAKRFQDQQARRRGYNPLDKKTQTT